MPRLQHTSHSTYKCWITHSEEVLVILAHHQSHNCTYKCWITPNEEVLVILPHYGANGAKYLQACFFNHCHQFTNAIKLGSQGIALASALNCWPSDHFFLFHIKVEFNNWPELPNKSNVRLDTQILENRRPYQQTEVAAGRAS